MNDLATVPPAVKYSVGIIALIVALGVVAVCVSEFRFWRAGRTLIDKQQLWLRFAGAGLLFVIAGMILFGVFCSKVISSPYVFLAYWSVCMALAVVLFALAIADLRRLTHKLRARERELYREFAQNIREEVNRLRGCRSDGRQTTCDTQESPGNG